MSNIDLATKILALYAGPVIADSPLGEEFIKQTSKLIDESDTYRCLMMYHTAWDSHHLAHYKAVAVHNKTTFSKQMIDAYYATEELIHDE